MIQLMFQDFYSLCAVTCMRSSQLHQTKLRTTSDYTKACDA